MEIAAAHIATIIQARLAGNEQQLFKYLAIDSRKISFPESTLFIALVSDHRNGHDFLQDAYRQGVRVFLVSQTLHVEWQDAALLTVPDTLLALQQLAAWQRQQFTGEVVGITGSNGKTIVKEWLYEMLQADENMVRSPKSFNSQIGVPLSVWMLHNNATLGIFEAGISQPGEMVRLQKIIDPGVGIFTMLGDAHNQGFESDQQKIAEKFLLFQHAECLICHTDNALVFQHAKNFAGELYNWGWHTGAWLHLQQQKVEGAHTILAATCAHQSYSFHIPFADEGSIENAMHCVVYLLMKGYDEATINQRLKKLQRLDMRLQWKRAIHHCFLLNDSYSNDFTSLQQAMEYWEQQARNKKRTLILSDLSVATGTENSWYQQLALLLQQKKVDRLIAIGPVMQQMQSLLPQQVAEAMFFDSTNALLAYWPQLHFLQEDILLKGGRNFAFEKIAQLLEAQVHQTELEIHLDVLAKNLKHFKSMLRKGTKIMVMVKAFGYGSGDAEVARTLQFNGVDYLSVAYIDEGVTLRQAGVTLPIMVLNAEEQGFDTMEQYNLEPEVYSVEMLQQLLQWCNAKGWQHYPVHIKIDTGMHRLGFQTQEVQALGQQLAIQPLLTVKSVFTHLVASEDADSDAFTTQQLALFDAACSQLQQALGYSFLRHAANSAAIWRHPAAHLDMVRLGVGLYGGQNGLQPVMQLHTTVAQVKKVPAGETVGYGRKGVVNRHSIIATVSIGYADGYRRCLSHGAGCMMVRGKHAPVVGAVCMDMTMLDVTDIPGVKAGDRVEVIGPNCSIVEMAAICNTITYEIMTGISQRVKRVYISE